MQLTNIIGQAFLVNIDSVVYAYERGDGATLRLSNGSTLLEVQETPAEVVTASDSVMVAFTALSGDVTGSIAVNPDFVLTVESADGGDASRIVLCDSNSETRATVVVDTAFASMDAIIEAASGGGLGYSVYAASLTHLGSGATTDGELLVGRIYTISAYETGDDFANVADVLEGTINTTGCVFMATGTTPTDWTNGSLLDSSKFISSVTILGDNTIGAIVWTFDLSNVWFVGTLAGAFTTDGTTVCLAGRSDQAVHSVSRFEVLDSDSFALEFGNDDNYTSFIEIRVYP